MSVTSKHTYRINEIFHSLQGEGYNTGTAAVFVRFAGCNLRCAFCDTEHQSFTEMTADEIAAAVFGCSSDEHTIIVLTGGEPALQVDNELIDALHAHHQRITIETNGTRALPDGIDWITVSPKQNAPVVLKSADEVKVVYEGQDVAHWLDDIQSEHYYLQPCSCSNTDKVIAYILQHPKWKLSLQTHKYIGIQ